ncbi:MAG TPA: 5-deoxy-glucuronate isomerase [Vicinamibacteria bacterium]|nr:5-deoxy-glucuronate isomerase [Vicinamibacteria bacterium]
MPAAEPKLHLPAGSAGPGGDPVHVTPASAGWSFSGLRVLRLPAGESRAIDTGEDELVVLPLSGSCTVRVDGRRFRLEGRRSVFERVSDFVYVPRDSALEVETDTGGEFALPTARARRRLEPAYGPAERVPVEVRGAGDATRQVTNFCTPESFATDRLTACELLTPAGNWSSFPPHKHDEAREGEAVLEEIYYFRVAGPSGFALHRTYAADGAFDVTATVGDGDVFLVPRGYHGPSVASPNHDLYYLNVLAGPGAQRTMAFCDDPAHHWIRESWRGMAPDPRVPMTSAKGRRP